MSAGPSAYSWPASAAELVARQEELARLKPELWRSRAGPLALGGCFVCFPRGPSGPGAPGDPAWAAAALVRGSRVLATATVPGVAGAAYAPGLLALREGRLLEEAVRALPAAPSVLLVDSTGRDHPRRAGLALQLGAVLEVPTVGVTHRPLLAEGKWPADEPGATSPLSIGDEVVACWLRVRRRARPLVVHPAWRTDLESAVEVVRSAVTKVRTPAPLRAARRAARIARARGER